MSRVQTIDHLETAFLPAARAGSATLARQRQVLLRHPAIPALGDAVPHPVAILNEQRQIVLANRVLRELLAIGDLDTLTGQRAGEALGCREADAAPGGCGTGEACRDCGAALAVAAAQQGTARELSCIIERQGECVPLEFAASASPLDVDGHRFVVLVLTDTRDQRRRRALERIFFHDVINTAGGVMGLGEALLASLPPAAADLAELGELLVAGSRQLIEEIEAQRDLAAAESGDLAIDPRTVAVGDLLAAVADTYRHHPVAADRSIRVVAGPAGSLQTDPRLLGRVVGNLIKNALEACPPGDEVRIAHRSDEAGVVITVWNPGEVDPGVRGRFFRRSVSTKGSGRGQGTYSVRLLTEHYLGGAVSWQSDAAHGTSVHIHLPGASG